MAMVFFKKGSVKMQSYFIKTKKKPINYPLPQHLLLPSHFVPLAG
jgi:hypothetical protein